MSYIPPGKRTTDGSSSGWAKSVKPEHKTISISSLEDFPTLGSKKPTAEPKKDSVISHSVSLADKLKKKLEEEKRIEEEKSQYDKEMKQKALEYEREYAAIQARSLHKKLYRTYASDVSNNEVYEEQNDELMYEAEDNSFEEY